MANDDPASPSPATPPGAPLPQRSALRRFVNRWEVDQAVFYALCLRAWQFLAGPVSIVVIGTFFTREIQGYYYTFASLIALQSFFELGLHIVIINVSSHEWSRLHLDAAGEIQGDAAARARLISLGKKLFAWYAAAAILFALGVGSAGGWFLAQRQPIGLAWVWPWGALVAISAVALAQLPYIVLLEGCGQMPVVNRYRLGQVMTANVVVWGAIAGGAGLWAGVVAAAVQVFWNGLLIAKRFGPFFRAFRAPLDGPSVDWQAELWPMQWRLGVSAIFNYFAFQLFTPVIFHYHGAVAAGQMGMTWQIATVLQAVALAWVQARGPLFGRLVAQQQWAELDRVYFRLSEISTVVVALGALLIGGGVWFLHWTEFRLAPRFLGPLPTALLLAAIVAYHIPNCQALYIRAHKRDPLFPLSVTSSIVMGLSVWYCGRHYGPLGAASAYLTVVVCLVLPWQTVIWWKCRREHGEMRAPGDQASRRNTNS